MKITGLRTVDVRFPTSESLDGSDAMNPDPDYSAAYVVLETDGEHEGHGLTFTIGRGNEICIAAIEALRPLVTGLELDWIAEDMGRFWHHITGDSQLRWIGPDKGAIHLATGAVVNAAWDLWAKSEGKPVWQLVAEMSPEELVRCIDFRYLTDCITPEWRWSTSRALRPEKRNVSPRSRQRAIPATPHLRGGWAMTTKNFVVCVVKRLMRGSTTSNSKSVATLRTTSAA